jgi:hypothetical protein
MSVKIQIAFSETVAAQLRREAKHRMCLLPS